MYLFLLLLSRLINLLDIVRVVSFIWTASTIEKALRSIAEVNLVREANVLLVIRTRSVVECLLGKANSSVLKALR